MRRKRADGDSRETSSTLRSMRRTGARRLAEITGIVAKLGFGALLRLGTLLGFAGVFVIGTRDVLCR